MKIDYPTHPGLILVEEFISPRGLSAPQAAALLGEDTVTVEDLIAGRRAVSAEIALKCETLFGVAASILLNMQASFDLHVASQSPDLIRWRESLTRSV